jgi:anti-anti-sigma factor
MSLLETISSGDILTISFTQEKILDAGIIRNMQEELLTIVGKAEEPNIVMDFGAVKFLSSAALGMLIRASKKCKEVEANLFLCDIAPNIREVFKITTLDKIFKICADSEEAEQAVKKEAERAGKKKGWFSW